MKCKTVIDASREEEVIIYAHERSRLVEEIEKLVREEGFELVGYSDKTAVLTDLSEVCCFTAEDGKVYAHTHSEKLMIKNRLYQIEEKLPESFIKINQSCVANIRQIKKFDATLSGTLRVIFKNGYGDYVSRRNLKKVKERLGL